MVTSVGVRTRFDLDLDFPILSPQSERRVIKAVQRQATKETRAQLARPWKRRVPVNTGRLRKSFTATIPRRPREKGYFVAAQVKHRFYFHFFDGQARRGSRSSPTRPLYPAFRRDLQDLTEKIVPRILADEVLKDKKEFG